MSEIFFIFSIVIFLMIILIPAFLHKRNKNINNYTKPDLHNAFGSKKNWGSNNQKHNALYMDEQLRQQKRMREQAQEQLKRQRQIQDRAAEQLRQQNKTQEFLQHQRRERERIAQEQRDILNRMRQNTWNK